MYCSHCGTPNGDSARFCQKCGTTLGATSQPGVSSGDPPPSSPPQSDVDHRIRGNKTVGDKQYAENKTPWLAALLSGLIVGVGQFYNGDMKKGAVMLFSALVVGGLTAGFGWLGIGVWSMVDAWKVAGNKWPLW